MGDGTRERPYTREDVVRLIKENGGKAEGLTLVKKIFEEPINLSGLDLHGINLNYCRLFRANFNGSNLDGAFFQQAYLGYAVFNPLNLKKSSLQGVDFRWANLHDAEFIQADLSVARFEETRVHSLITMPLSPDLPLESLPASLDRTNFNEANLFRASFKGCYFYGTKFEGAYIRGSDIFESHLDGADWGKYKIGEENKKDYHTAEYYYRHLKVWYKQSGYDDIASKFYFREKEASRKGANRRRDKISCWLSWAVFGHGEGWKRILFWIAGVVLAFTGIYYVLGTLTPNSFLDCLYYSAVSFIAVGYGGWVKESVGWVKGLGVFETFIGFFMMTLLLVTFVRKWVR